MDYRANIGQSFFFSGNIVEDLQICNAQKAIKFYINQPWSLANHLAKTGIADQIDFN
jgi:hypothetical protein